MPDDWYVLGFLAQPSMPLIQFLLISPATGDDCPDQHGWPVGQPVARGDDQILAVAESEHPDVLHCGLRAHEPGLQGLKPRR